MSTEIDGLRTELEELLQFLYLMPVAVLRLGPDGALEMINPKAVQLLQDLDIDVGQRTGPQILDVLCPSLADAWRASASPGPVGATRQCSAARPAGGTLHLLVQVVRVDHRATLVTLEDVTTAVEQERELGRQRRRMALALEQIRGYAVLMLDAEGTVIDSNPSIGRTFGGGDGALLGRTLVSQLAVGTAGAPATFEVIRAAVAAHGWWEHRAAWQRVDAPPFWGDCVITPLVETDGRTVGHVAVIRDATDEHERHQRLVDAAQTDPLTGLCNRRGLAQRVEVIPAQAAAPGGGPAWLLLDVDHFKQVNDRHGHDGGDAVLRALADVLRSTARSGDTPARLGGEEFVVLLPQATLDDALRVADRLRDRVASCEVAHRGQTLRVTASFGVALQAPDETWTEALERADEALYRAKCGGRNRVEPAAPPCFRSSRPAPV